MQGVYSFVGSLSSINPRQYRLLVSDVPQPRVLPKEGTLLTAGIAVFSLIIVENTMQVRKCINRACYDHAWFVQIS